MPWRSPPNPFLLRPATTDRALAALLLEEVAQRLAAAPAGDAVLLEGAWEEPGTDLAPRGAGAESAVREAAGSLGVPLAPVTAAPPTRRGPADEAYALLEPRSGSVAASEPTVRRAGPAIVAHRVPLAAAEGGAAGVRFQAHWFARGGDRLGTYLRLRGDDPEGRHDGLAATAAVIVARSGRMGAPATFLGPLPPSRTRRREWADGRLHRFRARATLELTPSSAARLVGHRRSSPLPSDDELLEHAVVLGASGGGKTALLGALAARRIRLGRSAVVVDLHGDLGPGIVARLAPELRERVVAVDASAADGRVAGLALLDGPGDDGRDVVAALRRLSADGGDVYWGFRIERVLESFVRLAAEEGGTLADVAELLTDPRRREAARRTTASPALARFLDDLGPTMRRNPEFLGPAAARVAKVLLDPRLRALLAPGDGGVPLAGLFAEGRSVLWRVPLATLGPEAASFAATLLLTRTYLTAVRAGPGARTPRVLLVVDEAHAISPRLLAEVLGEGRKFGVGAVLATQYPERLHPELRAAAAGSAGSHVLFRVPPAGAGEAGRWVGLDAGSAVDLLPSLPPGVALARRTGDPGGPQMVRLPLPESWGLAAWEATVDRTNDELGTEPIVPAERRDAAAQAVLLALFSGGPDPGTCPTARLPERARALAPDLPPEDLRAAIDDVRRRGWAAGDEDGTHLTPAGERALGVGGATGAPSESAEHRALLLETARIFARRGLRLEILAQGRFDARLPDAILPLVPRELRSLPPASLDAALAGRRDGWAWRFFGGRDVHVEAEVSGALRPERVRRGLAKARRAGAFALFVVADAPRARRVRSVLVRAAMGSREAQVWTLPRARRPPPPSGDEP